MEQARPMIIDKVAFTWWRPSPGCLICSSFPSDSTIVPTTPYDMSFELRFQLTKNPTLYTDAIINNVSFYMIICYWVQAVAPQPQKPRGDNPFS